jgi:hypothetical protein
MGSKLRPPPGTTFWWEWVKKILLNRVLGKDVVLAQHRYRY